MKLDLLFRSNPVDKVDITGRALTGNSVSSRTLTIAWKVMERSIL